MQTVRMGTFALVVVAPSLLISLLVPTAPFLTSAQVQYVLKANAATSRALVTATLVLPYVLFRFVSIPSIEFRSVVVFFFLTIFYFLFIQGRSSLLNCGAYAVSFPWPSCLFFSVASFVRLCAVFTAHRIITFSLFLFL